MNFSDFKTQFVITVAVGALTCDRQYNQRIADSVVFYAMNIPDELFTEGEDFDALGYAADLLDFEYALFEPDEEPEWIKRYFEWKSNYLEE